MTEAMAELGALDAMAELGALEAMAVQGALEAMVVHGDQEAMAVQGAQEAMAGGFSWPRPRPSARPLQPEPFYPPPPNFPGEVRVYQEPSEARQTGQYRTALRGQTDRTRHPTGTGSPPG